MASRTDYDAAIVGLGPVGAVLAALLGARGLRVLVIERSTLVYPQPRACHIDGEIVRIFQDLGLAAAIAPHIRPAPAYEFVTRGDGLLMRVGAAEIGPDGWFTHYTIYQPGLELAVRQRLSEMANVDIRLGASFTAAIDQPGGVAVHYQQDGAARAASAAFLIGCDGAGSLVRAAAGIELDDYNFDEPWLVLDVLVADPVLLPSTCIQYCHWERPTTCTPMGPGRHRWEFMLLPGEDRDGIANPESIARLLEPWGGMLNLRVERTAVYHFHGRIARKWRSEHIIIAGDAAHLMPPFAGQGLCSGIRDAHNLAWKLAAVLSADVPASILDTYQAERAPHARGILEMAIGAGRIVCTTDPAVAEERDREARERLARGEEAPSLPMPMLGFSALLGEDAEAGRLFPQFLTPRHRRSDDVLGDGPWLIGAGPEPAPAEGLATFGTETPTLAPFADAIAAWLSSRDARAVLVRPDRIVFGTGDPETLVSAWRRALTAPELVGADA